MSLKGIPEVVTTFPNLYYLPSTLKSTIFYTCAVQGVFLLVMSLTALISKAEFFCNHKHVRKRGGEACERKDSLSLHHLACIHSRLYV